jgi:hypothetical protein
LADLEWEMQAFRLGSDHHESMDIVLTSVSVPIAEYAACLKAIRKTLRANIRNRTSAQGVRIVDCDGKVVARWTVIDERR